MLSIITGRRPSRNLLLWGLLLPVCAVGAPGCDKLPLLAPAGSKLTLTTNSSVVQANGTAEIRATVLESSGTPVQNGTTVTFTTNLGTLSPAESRTLNGVAAAQFVANGQSGTATIRATSGNATIDPAAGLTLTVGGAAVGKVTVTANPNKLPAGGGTSTITAVVADTNGNPLNGIAVSFSTDAGSLSSSLATTSANGQATTTLTTNRDATVTAASGATATATVAVKVGTLPVMSFGAYTPANPMAGQVVTIPLNITTTAGNDPFQNVNISFGDGDSRDLGAVNSNTSVQHAYARDGIYTVIATGTGADGSRNQTSTQVSVSPRSAIGISLIASPNPVVHGNPTTFTVTFDGVAPTNVSGYDWTFGDGFTDSTSGKSTNHVYVSAAGSPFTARVTVRTTDGNSGNAQTQVVVN